MKKKTSFHAWQDSFSLGTGLIFLSLLAFASRQLWDSGFFIFLLGVYFFAYGKRIQKKKQSLDQWAGLKVLQALVLFFLGIIFMTSLPPQFFGFSFILLLIGLAMFIHIKILYFRRK